MQRTSGRSVTSKVVALFDAFTPTEPVLSLNELAAATGLTTSTAHRLANELVEWGGLERGENGGYRIGLRMWEIGALAPRGENLRAVALPVMQDLYEATQANVHLAVRDGTEAFYIEKIHGPRAPRVRSRRGGRLPLHATGVGKVLLAYGPDEVLAEVLGNLSRVTAYTITQPARLLDQVRRVRADGYATTGEEMSLGACSVAVPVRGPGGEVVAALGIVVPDLRRERARLVSALQVAAQGITRTLTDSTSAQWK